MTDRLFRTLCLVLTALLLPAAPAVAADDEIREFEIELLVFRNLINSDGGEIWPIDYSEWFEDPYAGQTPLEADTMPVDPAQDEQVPEQTQDQEQAHPGMLPPAVDLPAIDWLPESAYRLVAERNALGRSSQYRPLAYFAWRQPVLDRNQAQPLELSSENSSGDGDGAYVDGSVRVAVERYLHLYLDLKLHLPMDSEQLELLEYDIPEFRLKEHRRMRSRELHYFDHPRFGVIALITPYEKPPEEESGEEPTVEQ